MFLFTIVPVPINRDSDGNVSNNNLSPLASAQQRVKELESLLAHTILGFEYDYDLDKSGVQPYPGVNNSDLVAIKNALDKARSEETNLRNSKGGETDMLDHIARYSEVNEKLIVIEQRIKDLETLLAALVLENGTDSIDVTEIQEELNKTMQYKQTLEASKTYWNEIIDSHIKEENSKPTYLGDISEKEMINGINEQFGFVGIERIIKLHELLNSLVQEKSYVDEKGNPIIVSGVDNENETAIRNAIFKANSHLLMNLKKAQDEPWFNKLRDIAKSRNKTLNEKKSTAEERLKKLEGLLNALIKDEPYVDENGDPIVIKDVDNSDPNAVKQEIFRTRVLIQELESEKWFTAKIIEAKPVIPVEPPESQYVNAANVLDSYVKNPNLFFSKMANSRESLYEALSKLTLVKVNDKAKRALENYFKNIQLIKTQSLDSKPVLTGGDTDKDGDFDVFDIVKVFLDSTSEKPAPGSPLQWLSTVDMFIKNPKSLFQKITPDPSLDMPIWDPQWMLFNALSKLTGVEVNATSKEGILDFFSRLMKGESVDIDKDKDSDIFDAIKVFQKGKCIPQTAGDIDRDGDIDYDDITTLQKGLSQNTLTEEQKSLADINNDGKVDQKDVAELHKLAGRTIFQSIQAGGTKGDVNNDGKVDYKDLRALYETYLAELGMRDHNLTGEIRSIVDLTNDGKVDYKDIQAFYKDFLKLPEMVGGVDTKDEIDVHNYIGRILLGKDVEKNKSELYALLSRMTGLEDNNDERKEAIEKVIATRIDGDKDSKFTALDVIKAWTDAGTGDTDLPVDDPSSLKSKDFGLTKEANKKANEIRNQVYDTIKPFIKGKTNELIEQINTALYNVIHRKNNGKWYFDPTEGINEVLKSHLKNEDFIKVRGKVGALANQLLSLYTQRV